MRTPLPKQSHSAKGTTAKESIRHTQQFIANDSIKNLLDALPEAVVILDKFRQVVFINKACREIYGISDNEIARGLRPGDVLSCSHSDETPGGCGTTVHCGYCGANLSILTSQTDNPAVRECRITQKNTGIAIDLKVKAASLEINGEPFTIFSISDISAEKRQEVLQRLFFHDILNTAGGLSGYSELLLTAPLEETDEYKSIIYQLTLKIISEINSQKQLIDAENGTLDIKREEVSSISVLKETILECKQIPSAVNKDIILDDKAEDIRFTTDFSLLSRVLGNLTKNALEASEANQIVRIGCRQVDRDIEFFVNNQTVMPDRDKYQVFQRSFSTKGKGRGLGTYSIKLLTEKYLKGKVRLVSEVPSGTTFYVSYPIF